MGLTISVGTAHYVRLRFDHRVVVGFAVSKTALEQHHTERCDHDL